MAGHTMETILPIYTLDVMLLNYERYFGRPCWREIEGTISDQCLYAINEVRTLGVLLRYGFYWENGIESPVKDTTYLDVFLAEELDRLEGIE